MIKLYRIVINRLKPLSGNDLLSKASLQSQTDVLPSNWRKNQEMISTYWSGGYNKSACPI